MTVLPPIPEQPEDVRGRPIAISIAAMVASILGSAILVWLLLGRHAHGGGRSDEARPALVPPAAPFDEPTHLELVRQAQRATLDAWSWTDASHTRVRMPVSAAIDRYLGDLAGGPR